MAGVAWGSARPLESPDNIDSMARFRKLTCLREFQRRIAMSDARYRNWRYRLSLMDMVDCITAARSAPFVKLPVSTIWTEPICPATVGQAAPTVAQHLDMRRGHGDTAMGHLAIARNTDARHSAA